MTNNEILKADLLDILFEHRNKSYGAYALRRYYNNRLLIALAIALSIVVLFFLISLLNGPGKNTGSFIDNNNNNRVILSQIDLEQPKEPEQPAVKKPEPVAQKDFQNIQIVDDKDVKKPIAEHDDLIDVAISTIDVDGKIPDDPNKSVTAPVTESGNGNKEEVKPQNLIVPFEKQPSFPGGPEALALFFSKTLSAPADLEPGEKRVILVRFIVGADGSITKTEITQSGGEVYDREVLRSFKRMPKWEPAIQNGIKVATSFTQPVTFIGQEE